jgi:group II intron reverse transcriptase/maturase
LPSWIAAHKQELIGSLRDGSYEPQPVRGVEIPKAGGGMRQLGIPTVIDRLVQQAILQVLEPLLDPTFSPSSFGFRPGRGAHDALAQARQYVAEGRVIVVDVDLEKFFDRVNHDILMARLARRVADKRLLRIVRRFLEAGLLMRDGVCIERRDGTPQGGPLTPPTILRRLVSWTVSYRVRGSDRATGRNGRQAGSEAAFLCAVLQEVSRHGRFVAAVGGAGGAFICLLAFG